MPASYTHYRFGKLLLPALPGDVQRCIQRFRRMYDTGLQGPDPFFYYNIFGKSAVGDLGDRFHRQTGREFFSHAAAKADSEAGRAYLYGLLAHYCLDSLSHPFVDRMVAIGEAGHIALEAELDRVMMVKDGIESPQSYDRGRHIRLTRGECMTAAAFFPPATGANISRCIRGMNASLRFLAGANRNRTRKLMTRFAPGHLPHLVPEAEVSDYGYMIVELQELFDRALDRYPVLLGQLQAHMAEATPLGEEFSPDFG